MKNILFYVICGLAGIVFAEGTITETTTFLGPVKKYSLAWTASTNGIVSNTTTSRIRGELARVTVQGNGTGLTYSATLKDEMGVDVLDGLGANITSNAIVSFAPGLKIANSSTTNIVPIVLNDLLTWKILDAGSNRTGTAILYIK